MADRIKPEFMEFITASGFPQLLSATLLALYDTPDSSRPISNDTIRNWFWQAWGSSQAHLSPVVSPLQIATDITAIKADVARLRSTVNKRRREFRLGLFRLEPPRATAADLTPLPEMDAATVSSPIFFGAR